MRIAVIGAGKMGVWFSKFCKEKGDDIILADRNREKLAKQKKEIGVETTTDFVKAIKVADIVMICVSISSFEEVVKKIGPNVKDGQAVMDICSIKQFPVKVMHENIKHGLVLGTHPVFGPGSKGVKHKAYVLTPTNAVERKYANGFKNWLEKEEARVFIMTPEKHDQLMSVVLGLPHFFGLVACETLLEQRDFAETKQVAGTTYRMLFTLAEATALETPDLFANLQMNLPELGKTEDLYIAKAQEWLDLIKQKNPQAITDRMEQLKAKLLKADPDFAKSYEVMYRMLEATEE
jgi:prephenate dehydrogenase